MPSLPNLPGMRTSLGSLGPPMARRAARCSSMTRYSEPSGVSILPASQVVMPVAMQPARSSARLAVDATEACGDPASVSARIRGGEWTELELAEVGAEPVEDSTVAADRGRERHVHGGHAGRGGLHRHQNGAALTPMAPCDTVMVMGLPVAVSCTTSLLSKMRKSTVTTASVLAPSPENSIPRRG